MTAPTPPETAVSGDTISQALAGLPFTKMSGSGNDFVFFDGREVPISLVTSPEVITRICHRRNGIGADGIVVLEARGEGADAVVHYYNRDGTLGDMCGNATLCSTALSAALGLAGAEGMRLLTGAGLIHSRIHEGTERLPEIDFQPVTEIRPDVAIDLGPGENRVGYATAGIPHLVLLCENAEEIDVPGRGPGLRWHPEGGPKGANVNWVSPLPDGRWRYRTFERGVEDETLACGTGAVATAIMLTRWGLATSDLVTILSSSGRELHVRLRPIEGAQSGAEDGFSPSLQGEGRVVFRGTIGTI